MYLTVAKPEAAYFKAIVLLPLRTELWQRGVILIAIISLQISKFVFNEIKLKRVSYPTYVVR